MRRTKDVLALVAGVGICLSMATTAHAQATNGPPTVTASRNPAGSVRVGVPIAFTATASDPDGDTLTYLWDFGDGTTSTEQNPTKHYLAAATRTVTVTVSDGKEGGTVTSAPLTVVVQGNRSPSANGLIPTPQAGYAPLTVTFTGAGSDPDGPSHAPLSYSWDFDGDGTEDSTAQNPTHTFTTVATHQPRVTVRDPFGGSATRTFTINVLSEARDAAARFRILVFSRTAGFRHGSIPAGIAALRQLGSLNGIQVDAIEEPTLFTDAVLSRYDVVVFLSTTSDVLNDTQQAAFERFIRSGRGYVGIHSATDTEYGWPWYGQLTGGYFKNHPPGTPAATVVLEDADDHSTRHLPLRWARVDEWYNYQPPVNPLTNGGSMAFDYSTRNSGVHVLLTMDESTYNEQDARGPVPGEDGVDDDHPISWCNFYDGGRMWYTGMGHTDATYQEPLFLQHVLGGLEFAAGVVRSGKACGAQHASAEVSGTVPATLSLTVTPSASLGTFIPGVDRDYTAPLGATVTSTGGDATLAVTDHSATAPGRLVNGAFALARPLELSAVGGGSASPAGALGVNPLTLQTYSGPVSNDAVTVNLKQTIGANDPLRTGIYSKTLTFTLSTTSP